VITQKISHAEAQRRKALPRFRAFSFATLRLCVRNISSHTDRNVGSGLFVQSTDAMEISDLKGELEKLHRASFGWALSCCRHNHAEAEEVLQTVYLKVLQGKAVYRSECKLQTWLFAVIRKTAISERRKRILRTLKSVAVSSGNSGPHPEVELERSEMQQRFQHALARLPARQRETLHLVFYQDLSLSEAAEVMNISVGSARRHYERGKTRLREALDREGVEYGIGWRRKENSGAVL
jgi:RNA polymerase sigma factor (sigma-70 family)